MLFSPLISVAVESIALLDRHSDRGKIAALAERRAEATGKPLVIVKTAAGLRALSRVAPGSSIVFVDCAIECCNDQRDLDACLAELDRVTGSRENLFVMTIQWWAGARLALDPRVRWIVRRAPPRGEFQIRPFGRRRPVLAEVRSP